ncbi:MAG: sugar phosphate isomerase/epimerase [Spirochaetales bacterium]|jgi:sugar phosphate isomerase/epimerase|nr:sugar phosphate isomerase/epimerase [Spirochaetales bacterium]
MKIGCCTGMENYEELCRAGYDFIELAGTQIMAMSAQELEDARRRIDSRGVPCNGFNGYCADKPAMAGPGFDLRAAKNYAEEICRRGKALGIRVIGLGAPLARRLPEGFDPAAAAQQIREFIRVTAEEGGKQGITFLLEALNSHICTLLVHTREALDIVKSLNMPCLRMVLDFHHLRRCGEDAADIAYVMPYVAHLHIDHTLPDGSRHHLREEGIPFYRRCLNAARGCGYDGTLSIEPTVTASFREEAPESLHILRAILDGPAA